MSASLVVLELKPEEVEFLNNLRRCALCDHLGALHIAEGESYEEATFYCLIARCFCSDYK